MICLDTNAVIAVIDLRVPQIRARLERALLDGVTVGVPVIVLYELWYGLKKSARPSANATALATFLTLDVIRWPFEPEDAVRQATFVPRSSAWAQQLLARMTF
jgi:tRNA(fMet)-specific endonuclease VapC